jgi:hypothetical protein
MATARTRVMTSLLNLNAKELAVASRQRTTSTFSFTGDFFLLKST